MIGLLMTMRLLSINNDDPYNLIEDEMNDLVARTNRFQVDDKDDDLTLGSRTGDENDCRQIDDGSLLA
jgi:hypothetical protein